MYLSAEDARSDVILAGAAAVFGGTLLGLLLSAPGIPTTGVVAELIVVLAWFALSGLVPFLLARYREDVPGAFALGGGGGGRRGWSGAALLLAVPVAVLGALRAVLIEGNLLTAVGGRIGRALAASPVMGPASVDVVGAVLAALQVIVLSVGSLLLLSFLTVRGAEAFRTDERSATELLRTFGAGAIAVAAVAGLLTALTGASSVAGVGLNLLGAVGLLAVADRAVAHGSTITRPAVLTPLVVVVVAHLFASGGIFRGGLLTGVYTGAMAGLTAVVLAVTIQQGRRAALTVPLLVAVHWWPSCLSPLPFSAAGC